MGPQSLSHQYYHILYQKRGHKPGETGGTTGSSDTGLYPYPFTLRCTSQRVTEKWFVPEHVSFNFEDTTVSTHIGNEGGNSLSVSLEYGSDTKVSLLLKSEVLGKYLVGGLKEKRFEVTEKKDPWSIEWVSIIFGGFKKWVKAVLETLWRWEGITEWREWRVGRNFKTK